MRSFANRSAGARSERQADITQEAQTPLYPSNCSPDAFCSSSFFRHSCSPAGSAMLIERATIVSALVERVRALVSGPIVGLAAAPLTRFRCVGVLAGETPPFAAKRTVSRAPILLLALRHAWQETCASAACAITSAVTQRGQCPLPPQKSPASWRAPARSVILVDADMRRPTQRRLI